MKIDLENSEQYRLLSELIRLGVVSSARNNGMSDAQIMSVVAHMAQNEMAIDEAASALSESISLFSDLQSRFRESELSSSAYKDALKELVEGNNDKVRLILVDKLESIRNSDSDKSYSNRLAEIEFQLGELAEADGNWRDADNHYSIAASILPDDWKILEKASSLASRTGRHEVSLRLDIQRLSLATAENDIEKMACAHNDLAVSYGMFGKHENAKEHLKQALELDQKVHGENSLEVATDYCNLSMVCQKLIDPTLALSYANTALQIAESHLDADDAQLIVFFSTLAGAYHVAGDLRQAERLFSRVVSSTREKFGSAHPYVARRLLALAKVREELGENEEAEHNFREGIALAESTLGSNHPVVSTGLNRLGKLLTKVGRLDEAIASLHKSLAICEKSVPADHPDHATRLNNLGVAYAYRGDFVQALIYLNSSLNIREKIFTTSHPLVIDTKKNISEIEAMRNI